MDPQTPSDELRKSLEWELSLDNSDLRSHAWFHGTIPRQRAEELLADDGDFLIRDCISRPGDYVLTCKWRLSPLHFVINKVVQQPNTVYEKIQFQFEDDCFDTVPDLVTYYVGNRIAISAASGALISKPINRSMPLSYYASRYGLSCQMTYAMAVNGSEGDSSASAGPPDLPTKYGTRNEVSAADQSTIKGFLNRMPGEPLLSPTKVRPQSGPCTIRRSETGDQPPPKPSRIATTPHPKRHVYSATDGAFLDRGNFEASRRKASGETRFSFLDRPSISDESPLDDNRVFTLPVMESQRSINAASFVTSLLPPENKPLEPTALLKLRSILSSTGTRILANHLTKVDLGLLKCNKPFDLGLGVTSGLELISLPQGLQLCCDLLERTACLKFFIAVLVLTCGSEDERAQMLHKWIQVAVDTKSALGNLYGFTGIMLGLSHPQVSRLKSTWLALRRMYTESALTFETKLRPTMKSMQECSNPQAPNTCIPHLASLATILQRHLEVVTTKSQEDCKVAAELCLPWEQSTSDYGLQLLLTHLQVGRAVAAETEIYRRNGEIVLENVKFEPLVLDVFRSEFQTKFMWGARGATVDITERFDKFDQVLAVMSERCESS